MASLVRFAPHYKIPAPGHGRLISTPDYMAPREDCPPLPRCTHAHPALHRLLSLHHLPSPVRLQVSNPCTITISGQPGSVGAAERAVIDLVEDRPSPFGGGMPPGGAAGPGGGFGGPGGGFGGGPPAYGGYGPGSGYPGYGSYGGMPAYGGMPYAQPAYGMPYGAPQYAPQYPQVGGVGGRRSRIA